ncbi:hypothetical protein [Enterococcus devriesei]|uniref:hypothetical protein n=1 Tax=Enterococcus devriesei TaxID=319970 RepID=UPI0036D223AD
MTWVLVQPFGPSGRVAILQSILEKEGIPYENIVSDFSHIRKKKFLPEELNNTISIKTIPYYKNLSIKRLISHVHFSIKASQEIRKLSPDYVYCLVPTNSLIYIASKMYSDAKFVADIYDLWPESFPSKPNFVIKILFFFWKRFREVGIKKVSYLILESNLYRRYLSVPSDVHCETIYPVAVGNDERPVVVSCKNDITKGIHFCYLGTINNIVDLDSMQTLFKSISRDRLFSVHFIGKGESKEIFKKIVLRYGGDFIDHGVIFEEAEKNEVIQQCHFGLNLFSDNTIIGLSLKSIEYLKFGLPLLSNLDGDTKEYICSGNIGIQYFTGINTSNLVRFYEENPQIRDNVRSFYNHTFSKSVIENQWSSMLQKVTSINNVFEKSL